MQKKLRRLGDITSDLEKLLLELHVDHDMQHHEVLGLIHAWQMVHVPGQVEVYTKDGSSPVYYYGPASKSPKNE